MPEKASPEVLIVEDASPVYTMFQYDLDDLGITHALATRLDPALELVKSQVFKIILVDGSLQSSRDYDPQSNVRTDGELVAKIAKEGINKDALIIDISSSSYVNRFSKEKFQKGKEDNEVLYSKIINALNRNRSENN